MSQATKDTQAPQTETTKRCNVSKVKVGDTYSRLSFGTVVEVKAGALKVRNNKGDEPWDVSNAIVENEFAFAGQFEATKEVNRTDAIEILKTHPRTAMTVHFNKMPDHKAVAEELAVGKGSETDKAWNSKVKKLLEGVEREMIGYHLGSWDEFGRLHFHETGKGLRTVDPRSLNWLVVERSRYNVK